MPKERSSLLAYTLLERVDHARNFVEPAAAIGECANAGQHDAVGTRHCIGIARHSNWLLVIRFHARRVQTPWPPNADCRSHSRRWRRSPLSSRLGEQTDDIGRRRRPAPHRRRIFWLRRSRRIGRRTCGALAPLGEKAPLGDFSILADNEAERGPTAARQGPAPYAGRLEADQQGDQTARPEIVYVADARSRASPTPTKP